MYVCGITPYDTTHLGHAFTYIVFDTLARYLQFKGYRLRYTQNVTDINDRDQDLLKRSKEQNIPWHELASYWTGRFLTDMDYLNWLRPDKYLKASDNIPAMVKIIQMLIRRKLAYKTRGGVYLEINRSKGWGKLSKLSRKKMLILAKEFEEDLQNPDKKDPLDITLWRPAAPSQPSHIPSFASPLGPGRPGWHIECSAMAISSLGEQIDIHGGGKDLLFPHHEAEIAQSEGATGKIPFAKYWLHTGTVYYQGEKMSKSKGNLVMVSKLLEKYSTNAIRWLLLSHHWNKPWEYTESDLAKAWKNVEAVEQAIASPRSVNMNVASQDVVWERNYIGQFTKIMDQNLNTPKALQFLLQLTKQNATGLKSLYKVLGFKI